MPTSSGAGVSLSAIGKQESYIHSDNIDESIFNYDLKKHSNFTKFHRTTIVNRSPTSPSWPFNERIKVTFNPRNMGDLLSNMYLLINLPGLSTGQNYADQIGRHLIKSVTMRVDGIEVEKIYDDWMVINDELYIEVSEKVANRASLNRMLGFDATTKNGVYASLDSEVIIPLPFFFSRKYSSDEYKTNEPNRPFFPLCAIHKQKIEFEFEFHTQKFFTTEPPEPTPITLANFKIVTEEFTIDPNERIYLKNRPYTMITDVISKHPTSQTVVGVDTIRTDLVPNNRVKSIHWFLRNTDFEDTNIATFSPLLDIYTIHLRETNSWNGAFTLKNISFFTTLTQGGVTTFSRVGFVGTPTPFDNDAINTEKVGVLFSTEYNIVPWIADPGSVNPIITVAVPANSFIEKFSFEFYTESSSREVGEKRYTNIPGIDIKKNDKLLLDSQKISNFVSLRQETFTQSYSIELDTTEFRVPDANFTDYYYIQNRFNFSTTPDFDETFTFFNPVMKSAKFFIQGVDLPNISSTTDSYYKYMIPYQKRLSKPVRNIYTYSFAIHPINVNPSGSLDFSEIKSDKTSLEIQLQPGLEDVYTLYIYYTGYQTFTFENGFMSLVY